mmetsp:Transcript_80772/g.250707  ORF Transcript_80772/g.250707 Transcript_80772/m.250707 type:complete len:314 (-) Transcript_80772:1124-2065(-)
MTLQETPSKLQPFCRGARHATHDEEEILYLDLSTNGPLQRLLLEAQVLCEADGSHDVALINVGGNLCEGFLEILEVRLSARLQDCLEHRHAVLIGQITAVGHDILEVKPETPSRLLQKLRAGGEPCDELHHEAAQEAAHVPVAVLRLPAEVRGLPALLHDAAGEIHKGIVDLLRSAAHEQPLEAQQRLREAIPNDVVVLALESCQEAYRLIAADLAGLGQCVRICHEAHAVCGAQGLGLDGLGEHRPHLGGVGHAHRRVHAAVDEHELSRVIRDRHLQCHDLLGHHDCWPRGLLQRPDEKRHHPGLLLGRCLA